MFLPRSLTLEGSTGPSCGKSCALQITAGEGHQTSPTLWRARRIYCGHRGSRVGDQELKLRRAEILTRQ